MIISLENTSGSDNSTGKVNSQDCTWIWDHQSSSRPISTPHDLQPCERIYQSSLWILKLCNKDRDMFQRVMNMYDSLVQCHVATEPFSIPKRQCCTCFYQDVLQHFNRKFNHSTWTLLLFSMMTWMLIRPATRSIKSHQPRLASCPGLTSQYFTALQNW